jgi:hypothetical protein
MRTSLLLAVASLSFAAPALAQSYAPGAKPAVDDEPAYVEAPAPSRGGYGPRTSDRHGFFFRGTLGIGGGSIGNSDSKFAGAAGLSSLAIGGSVAPNFALGAESFAVVLSEPKLTANGTEYATKSGTSVNTAGLGLMGTYYFVPSNVYLSGTLGFARTTVEVPNTLATRTDSGIGGNVKVGKEWPVSQDWTLGVAGHVIFATVTDADDKAVSTTAFGVAFSATYF